MAKPGISAQLIVYGARPSEDLGGVLAELAEIGYDGAEIGANFIDGDRSVVQAAFESTGLRPSGVHAGYGLVADPEWQDRAVDFVVAMGAERIICSGVSDNESLAGYADTGETFNAIGAKCQAAGLEFCYHNHAWEFRTFDGVKGIHKLCEVTDPALVKLNMDVYWVTVGGEDPAEFITRYRDRVGYYHFKDGPYTASGSVAEGPYTFTELGKGTVDLAGALKAARAHDPSWVTYEQDRSEIEPKDAARISFEHLKSLGL
jgi:sugar phosphate isomerase/epimerase